MDIEWIKFIEDSLDEFNKLVLDLEDFDIKIYEEDKVVILLHSPHKSFKYSFKNSSANIQNALNFKLLDL